MVEFGNSLDPDKEFDVLRCILDFPMELLEGDEVTEDWEIGDAQCFGPIPSNILMELPMISNEEFDSPNVFPRPVAPIAGAPEQRKLAMVQESGSFPTERPISVLESSGSCSREKSLSIKSDNAIPALRRSKRVRCSGTDPELSTPKQTSNARKSKVSRKRLSVAMDLIRNSPENVDNSLNVSDPAHQIASDPPAALVKKCAHCQSSKTPLWREGPLGPKTLCNACGVRYRSGCLFPEYRPLASPTFVPSQHSNSHKKVAEMRNKAKRLKVETKVAPLSPHKEAKFEEPPIVPQMEAKILELPSPELETDGAPEQKKLPLHTDISNSLIDPQITGAPDQKHVERVQLAKHVETPTYISLLESSRSYLKFRSIYFKHAGAKPWVPLSPPYEKTSGEEKSFEMNAENDDKSLNSSDCALLQNGSNSSCPALVKEKKKKCTHCLSTKTPQQRKGPLGPDTLCNACGQQYQAGHLVPEFQLYASPTFVPAQRTKSLRKLGQMRTKHMQSTADIKVDGAPEQKQLPLHIDISNSLISPQITGAPKQKHIERMQLAKHGETSTHVSLLESSRSYLKFRSIYFEHAGAKPWVPPSPPYEKTSGEEKSFGMHVENDDKSLDCSDCALLQNGSNSSSPALVKKEKKCAHCQSTETPLWREGPLGPHTLCNACGKQYRAGLLVPEYRPAASPMFVPSQHSNYHTKLVKMRAKPMRSGADIKIDGASELAKHADTSSSLTHPQIVRTSEQKQVEQMHADTPSHGSLLESSRSYLKYRSKYVKHAGAKPYVPPSPCKKTSCEEKLFEVPFKNDDDNTHDALLQNASNPCPGIIKKCTHCQLTKTPRWRKGPLGPCTLCNACGLQYRAGCLVPESRPYATSTFVPAQHSKSTRKLVQMRTKPMQSTADKKIDGVPELAKHVDTSSSLIRPQIVGTPKRNHLLLHIDASNSLHSLQIDVAPEQKHVEQMHHDTSSHVRDNSGCASLQNASNPCPALDKKCANCQSTKTLQWRKGPLGTPTLCNACGLQFRAGRLVPESQPYATPTFMPAQRSKSIRKLVQMRTKPMQPTADIEIAKKKCCAHCQPKTTPDWRKGRLGPCTLCSACGKQYGAGRLVPEYLPLPRQRFRLLHKDDAAQC